MNKLKKVSIIIPTFNRSKDAISCISSVMCSTYGNIEIIVIDNGSTDKTFENLKWKFKQSEKIKLIRSENNLGAGGGRNRGATEATGNYLLFIDSDNIVDKEMIFNLCNFFEKTNGCGMVGPLMLFKNNPEKIWLYYADINMWSSKACYKGFGEKNKRQYNEVIETGHLPNCFMVKRDDFEKVGGFDEKYFIMYEEADLAEKIKKKLKKKIYLFSKAITYHDFPIDNDEVNKNFGFRSSERAYLTSRNRIYFMKRNASIFQFLIFVFVFNPLILVYYETGLLKNGQFQKAWSYFKGFVNGFFL